MIKKNEEFFEQLVAAGLTEYEAKAYLELIKVHEIGATKLASKSNVSRGRIYDVLEGLIRKGYCKMISGVKKKFRAISPQNALENRLTELKAKMIQQERFIQDTSKGLQKIYDSNEKEDHPEESIQILTSQTAIKERIKQLQYECKNILRVFIKAPILMDQDTKESDRRMDDQVEKKLKIKQIYEYDEIKYQEFAASVFKARSKGADFDVRVSMKLPLKLVIFDDDHALFTLNREAKTSFNYSMMSVSHTYLTKAMVELFEFYWNASIPLKEFVKDYPYQV